MPELHNSDADKARFPALTSNDYPISVLRAYSPAQMAEFIHEHDSMGNALMIECFAIAAEKWPHIPEPPANERKAKAERRERIATALMAAEIGRDEDDTDWDTLAKYAINATDALIAKLDEEAAPEPVPTPLTPPPDITQPKYRKLSSTDVFQNGDEYMRLGRTGERDVWLKAGYSYFGEYVGAMTARRPEAQP